MTQRRKLVVELAVHPFLIYELDRDEWSASRCGRFTPEERAAGAY